MKTSVCRLRGSWTVLIGLLALWLGCGGGGGDGGRDGGGDGGGGGENDVVGTVIFATGQRAPNVPVYVNGIGPVYTDGMGRFDAGETAETYTVVLSYPSQNAVDVWDGLTRRDPIFTLDAIGVNSGFGANFAGAVSGGAGYPEPVNHETRLFFGMTGGYATPGNPLPQRADGATGDYAADGLSWFGPVEVDLHVYALQYEADMTGVPVALTGYGTTTRTVGNVDQADIDVTMETVQSTSIAGSVSGVVDAASITLAGYLKLPGNATLLIAPEPGNETDFSLLLPDLPESPPNFAVEVKTLSGEGITQLRRNLAAPTTGLNVALPAVTSTLTPTEGAQGVDHDTVFTVSAGSGDRIYRYSFEPNDSADGPRIRVFTASETAQVPDLSDYGILRPREVLYSWGVRAFGPVSTLDEAAEPLSSPQGIFAAYLPSDDAFSAVTDSRSFTFAP